MDTSPITARSLQKPYHIKGDDFERAYKDFLSGYRSWKELAHAEEWLVFYKNIGPHVSIDETSLSDGELYTIVSNKDAHGGKGSIIAIIKGTKVETVVKALQHILWFERARILEVTMDFSESMHAIVKQSFPYATITIDRFHVQKDCCEAMQQLRVKYRRQAQREEAKAKKQLKLRNKQNAERRKKYLEKNGGKRKGNQGRKPIRKNRKYEPKRLSNGDTVCELLSRSRYLLMTSAEKWTESQKTRAALLFELFPELQKAYSLTHSLRMIFSNKFATKDSARSSFNEWIRKVKDFGDRNFCTVATTIADRQGEILNYFINRATNASAESLNAKIKLFRAQLHGVVDVKFFLFRLTNIYA